MGQTTSLPVPAMEDDFCLVGGIVRWSQGSATLRKGQRFEGDERLLAERPDLFGSLGDLRAERRQNYVYKVECRQCGQPFIPAVDMAQYCSKSCRRDRETLLRRAARNTNEKKWPSLPHGDSKAIYKYIQGIDERTGLLHLLINHLGHRAYPYDPKPVRDEVELRSKLTDGQRLLVEAKYAFTKLYELRATALTELTYQIAAEEDLADQQRTADRVHKYLQVKNAAGMNWDRELDELDAQAGFSSRAAGLAAAEQIH